MTTTIDSLAQYPAKVHHHAVAFAVAALLLVGTAVGTTAVIANDNNGSTKVPALSTQPFKDQPLLKVSGAR